MSRLDLSRVHFPVTALGPGRRIGIWMQGCSLRCPGCISADTWAAGRSQTTVEAVMTHIAPWLGQADGVTISGGEPFQQSEALVALLTQMRSSFAGDILVYTGYETDEITSQLTECCGLIDALISGRFRREAPQTLPLRGSDNQMLRCLTPLGKKRFAGLNAPTSNDKPALDVMFDEDGAVWFAGIPKPADFERLQAIALKMGHQLFISSDKSARGRE